MLLGFVAVFVVALATTGWTVAQELVSRLTLPEVVLCVLASTHYLLRALRWHLLVSAGGIGTRLTQNMRQIIAASR